MTHLDKYEWNAIAKGGLGPIVIAIMMFASAGTLEWRWSWIMNGLHFACWSANTWAVATYNRELLAERGKRRTDTAPWDKWLSGMFGFFWIVELALASLDVRYAWTDSFPLGLRVLGVLLMVAGFALLTWAMVVNRHFEPGVRIQSDRMHQVVSTGPYRFVRHPGYTAAVAAYFLGMPLQLGSLPSFFPAVAGILTLWLRTCREDAFLLRNLDGYATYAQRVRHRWLPGLF